MNQRFNAHDLWTRVCQEEMPELDESCMTMQRTRKFAELIVRECAHFITETATIETLLGDRLKEHFGVKE